MRSGGEKEKPRAGSVWTPSEFPTAGSTGALVRPHTAATIVVLACSRGGGDAFPMTADDDGEHKTFSWTARTAIAIAVFSLGMLVGAAVAAWVVPPS